jgi:glutamate-ammonia-ligase adenylyltransferase
MLKARPVAGDRELGMAILARLEAWLYRRYLNEPDETGIKALKRRIMTEATLHQDDWRDVCFGRGALRDLEATIEFLQLLTGGDQAAVRQRGTLAAMEGLELAGAISADERRLLDDGYLYVRRLLHRLQILIEPAASEIPEGGPRAQRIAASLARNGTADDLAAELRRRTTALWETLRKLLNSAFAQEPSAAREVELLLDPSPAAEEVRAALAPFGFAEPMTALAALNDLAAEQVSFLSTRRCRHLLASILPRLLSKIGATPDPDRTLDNLARVSNSLGGKAVLWELIRASPPSLELYVRLCAASPYLSGILTTNPGMIDELVDSLQLDRLASRSELEAMLDDLCRGVSDTLPILHDFKNANILRIGVREILGKDDIDATHQALTDVAEICLTHVAELEYGQLTEKFGVPTIGAGPREGDVCRLVIGGLRKFGARDLNYHSRLDVVFLYEADGATRRSGRGRQERTANHHFFTQFAQRVIKQLGQLTPKGRLYTTDALLRPIGVAGALVLSLAEFRQHFAGGGAPFWHWQALYEARCVYGEGSAREYVEQATGQLIVERPWKDTDLSDIRRYRLELQQAASSMDIKRGPGGTQDVELVVRMLQLRHAAEGPPLLVRSPQDALVALSDSGIMQREVGRSLAESYRFLRRVQSGLALMNVTAHNELPADPQALGQLALLLGHSNPQRLREQCAAHMAENCESLDTLLTALGSV